MTVFAGNLIAPGRPAAVPLIGITRAAIVAMMLAAGSRAAVVIRTETAAEIPVAVMLLAVLAAIPIVVSSIGRAPVFVTIAVAGHTTAPMVLLGFFIIPGPVLATVRLIVIGAPAIIPTLVIADTAVVLRRTLQTLVLWTRLVSVARTILVFDKRFTVSILPVGRMLAVLPLDVG
ncbi:MAG TPA: hypothetical protein VKI65_05670 [Gemmataceae bacterium]|nr:hypothetical protein [Gemmataceae bacterium]